MQLFFTEENSFVVNPNQNVEDPEANINVCKQKYGNIDMITLCLDCEIPSYTKDNIKDYCWACK